MVELNPAEMGDVVNRLRRAQGQIGGVLRMIEEGPRLQGHRHPARGGQTVPWTGPASPSSRPA